MARTPKGFLSRTWQFCPCLTEADQLICCALSLKARGVKDPLTHPADTEIEPFYRWIHTLAVDLYRSKGLSFRAIMDDLDRRTILRELRKRGDTKL